MNSEEVAADVIADVVLEKYNALPARSKPQKDAKGNYNWVPLSGIVLTRGNHITCVSVATGMRCLPSQKVPEAQGLILHDWHAEILAIRGFNHFLIQQCDHLAQSSDHQSPYIRRRKDEERSILGGLQPFTIHESVRIHMYCSDAPCGDASMELIMDQQEDPTPWRTPAKALGDRDSEGLKGRGYFSDLGIVRRKPSRSDSPQTLSKSCSDKLSLKQCTSLLPSPSSLLISPENAYLDSLILPLSQYNQNSCHRAFSSEGRMKPVAEKMWEGGYRFRPFQVRTTAREFGFSRKSLRSTSGPLTGSNVSAVWTPILEETLINGVRQGRKQNDPRGASAICRLRTCGAVMVVLKALAMPAFTHLATSSRYSDLKQADMLNQRRIVKEDVTGEALAGWIPNVIDDFEIPQK